MMVSTEKRMQHMALAQELFEALKKAFLKFAENMGFHKLSITNGAAGFLKVPKKAWKTVRNPG